MPFLCLRHRQLPASDLLDHWIETLPPGERNGWRRQPAGAETGVSHRAPCGMWQGSVDDSNYLLLCDGFLSRPYRYDSVAGSGDLHRLAVALARQGAAALDDVEGQYAVCFVNKDTGTLLGARDALGAKVLYWTRSDDMSALGSNSADLARLPGCTVEENPRFMSEMFTLHGRHDPAETPFLNVTELIPGGRITVDGAGVRLERPPFAAGRPAGCVTGECWLEAFRDTFTRAVTDSLDDTGDIAVMLSGGLDSGPILQTAARARDRRVLAIGWSLPDHPECDEARWIKAAAEYADAALTLFDGGDYAPFSDLSSRAISAELPYYNPVRGILLRCYEIAAEQSCSVVLAGTRGDLIYPPRSVLLHDLVARREWSRLWGELRCMYRGLGLRGMYREPALRYPVSRRLRPFRRRREPSCRWLTERAASSLAPPACDWPPEAESHGHPEHARSVLGPAMTFGTAQENDFAQRFGVERRDPFHSAPLVRLMLQMPVALSHTCGWNKWIMRQAMRGRMPDSIRLKHRTGILSGFIRSTFEKRRERVREFLLDHDAWERYVEPRFVRDALASPGAADADIMVICGCIGYTLWRNAWGAGR